MKNNNPDFYVRDVANNDRFRFCLWGYKFSSKFQNPLKLIYR